MDYSQLRETVLKPENRTLEKITIKDAEKASKIFDILMGKNVSIRRDFIEKNTSGMDINIDI